MTERRRPRYDPEANAAYFPTTPVVARGFASENLVIERPGGDIVLDFNADGHLLGVEVIGARRLLTPEMLEDF